MGLAVPTMSSISDFINDESVHEHALAKAMHWEYIEDQQKGSSYDFIAPDGAKIEAKFDWDSMYSQCINCSCLTGTT